MKQFRKKPVVIEAISCREALRMMGEDFWALPQWFIDAYEGKNQAGVRTIIGRHHPSCIEIVTLEGTMTADLGDWIIQGVNGELYPCKPDIFAATYESVEPEENGPVSPLKAIADSMRDGTARFVSPAK